MATQKAQVPEEVLTGVQQNLADEACAKKAMDIFRQATEKVLDKLKQSAIADITASTKETVVRLTTELGQKLLNVAEGWNRDINHNLLLYPEGTRFVARKVATQVIVIEQKPQVRTLNFHHNLFNPSSTEDGTHRFQVALPYVYFFLVFHDNKFSQLQVGFRSAPLMSLDDQLGRPPLPNIDNGLKVCMGGEFGSIRSLNSKDLCKQVNTTISTFWQSRFNKDISDEYQRLSQADPRFELKRWEKESKANPLWILEHQWANAGTLTQHLDKIGGSAAPVDITAQLQKEVTAVVSTVSDKLKRSLDAVAMGKIRPGELTTQFGAVLRDVIQESYSQLWEYCEAKLATERTNDRRTLEGLVKKELESMLYYSDMNLKKKAKDYEDYNPPELDQYGRY